MTDSTAPADDRFAHWSRLAARLLLLALALVLVAAALVPIKPGGQNSQSSGIPETTSSMPQPAADPQRDADLALYDRVIKRVGQGENYYAVAAEEHRKADYPLRPGVVVRLPTLAYLLTWLGDRGQGAEVKVIGEMLAAALLMAAILWAWWRRLGEEPGGARYQLIGTTFMFMGASLGMNPDYFVLHELWAGMLVALAIGLHRPGRKWGAALAAAALALAIREHVLPFVLLLAAMAFWRRNWKEGAAWSGLAAAFALFMIWHLGQVAQHVVPSDVEGPDWLVLRGLSGWLSNVVLSSSLRSLPHFIAGPLVVLMVLGWAGWKSSAGNFAALLYLGYGLAFMIAGRAGNFYWGAIIAPAMFIGLAFAPRALRSLWQSAGLRSAS